jgi:hypothetical protein
MSGGERKGKMKEFIVYGNVSYRASVVVEAENAQQAVDSVNQGNFGQESITLDEMYDYDFNEAEENK